MAFNGELDRFYKINIWDVVMLDVSGNGDVLTNQEADKSAPVRPNP